MHSIYRNCNVTEFEYIVQVAIYCTVTMGSIYNDHNDHEPSTRSRLTTSTIPVDRLSFHYITTIQGSIVKCSTTSTIPVDSIIMDILYWYIEADCLNPLTTLVYYFALLIWNYILLMSVLL